MIRDDPGPGLLQFQLSAIIQVAVPKSIVPLSSCKFELLQLVRAQRRAVHDAGRQDIEERGKCNLGSRTFGTRAFVDH